ncbi:sirohydrochlorin chelatase [Bacillus sp. Marseille-Q3570]|uniref:sirohydrochlorin chelatase n=1 Tax=Bacillus sp. Marseille-Q3570 TaxID=2963522 RepID=UPI0021B71F5E|nr:sirohydrochlorin chelatase [Bacillus sp. Marseille-Q3570]
MQAILYVGHGSRVEEARNQAAQFMKQSMEHQSIPIQEISFLELAHPSIEVGFKRCVERGATSIAIIPILLLTAGHAKKDIPMELVRLQSLYPAISITYGRPFGVHEKIIDILIERIYDKVKPIDDAMVLLVGRGSSDPDVTRDLREIADRLYEKHRFKRVETSFLAAAEPSFEEGLEQTMRYGHKQVLVVPYLLFTGILMKSMEKTIRKLTTENQDFILCDYLGYHPNLQEVVSERVQELIGVGV